MGTVEKQLKSLFKFKEYAVLDNSCIMGHEDQNCSIGLAGSTYHIDIDQIEVKNEIIKLAGLKLQSHIGEGTILNTTVNIKSGDTIILGSSRTKNYEALITVVTAKITK